MCVCPHTPPPPPGAPTFLGTLPNRGNQGGRFIFVYVYMCVCPRTPLPHSPTGFQWVQWLSFFSRWRYVFCRNVLIVSLIFAGLEAQQHSRERRLRTQGNVNKSAYLRRDRSRTPPPGQDPTSGPRPSPLWAGTPLGWDWEGGPPRQG